MKRLLVFIVFLCGCSGESFSSGLFQGGETPDAGEHTDSAPFLGSGGATGTGGALGKGGAVHATGGERATGGAPELDAYAAGGQPGTGGADADAGPPSSGGVTGTGGTTQAGGSPGTGGSVSCATSEKACNGTCTNFGPGNGCSAPGCTACPTPPQNSVLACNVQGQCDFNCLAGFVKSGNTCCALVMHDNGIGQTWQDCIPLGTWNQTQAMAACRASGAVHCLEGGGCGGGNLYIAGYNQDSSQHIGSWGYGGFLEGTACSIDNCGPSCPGPLTWN